MKKETREHLIQHIREINDPTILSEIKLFNQTDCVIGRAAILKNIKETSDYTYEELSTELFENKRQLIRIIKLNNLIGELKVLTQKRLISKVAAYEISSFSKEKQKEYYQLIQRSVSQKKNSKRKTFKYTEYLALKELDNNVSIQV
ncbi:hypothetical protein [Psychrobacillus sp. FSL H8-0487]|uniref:hypothetical protein n=1 Tax=Psychrobacillus sp. FSL H8-0487 TaxID=2921391 RepID=UPI0030F8E914